MAKRTKKGTHPTEEKKKGKTNWLKYSWNNFQRLECWETSQVMPRTSPWVEWTVCQQKMFLGAKSGLFNSLSSRLHIDCWMVSSSGQPWDDATRVTQEMWKLRLVMGCWISRKSGTNKINLDVLQSNKS